MVLSPDAETMYFSSKSTTFTAARWPTRTRRKLISWTIGIGYACTYNCEYTWTCLYGLTFTQISLQTTWPTLKPELWTICRFQTPRPEGSCASTHRRRMHVPNSDASIFGAGHHHSCMKIILRSHVWYPDIFEDQDGRWTYSTLSDGYRYRNEGEGRPRNGGWECWPFLLW